MKGLVSTIDIRGHPEHIVCGMIEVRETILSLRRCSMGLYAGFDLHSNNTYIEAEGPSLGSNLWEWPRS